MTNSSGDYTWSVTGQLQKSFTTNFEGSVAYTHQKSMDVTSTTSSTAGSNYRYQRDVSGDILDKSVSTSKYDQPHRIVATGTYRFKTLTDLSLIYTGNSGAPFDYVYGVGTGTGSGDANADGQSQNDLIYVPKNAHDPNEILFTGYNGTAAQQAAAATMADAFDKFISSTPCLQERARHDHEAQCLPQSVGQRVRRHDRAVARLALPERPGALRHRELRQPAQQELGSSGSSRIRARPAARSAAPRWLGFTQTGNKLPAGVTNSTQAIGIYTFDTGLQAVQLRERVVELPDAAVDAVQLLG